MLSARHVQLARDSGALAVLPIALASRALIKVLAGDLRAAASLLEEVRAVTQATGTHIAPYGPLTLAAWRGIEANASKLIETSSRELLARGERLGLTFARWAGAVLYNGLGRHEDALPAALQACEPAEETRVAPWGLIELIEAAVRSGQTKLGAAALDRLAEMTRAGGTDWALGVEARSRALLSEGQAADSLYRQAIERLRRTRIRTELARAHLLYGEWLRRERHRADAREQLRRAREMFTAMGVEAFAARAERELSANGARAPVA